VRNAKVLDASARRQRHDSLRPASRSISTRVTNDPQWLEWVKRLQALAQTGLAYSHDVYDRERFEAAQEIAAESAAAGSDAPLEKVRELFHAQTGYATPKVDVRGVIFRDDRILLVRDVSDGCWTLPGGWADVLESPREAVEREVREESGFVVR